VISVVFPMTLMEEHQELLVAADPMSAMLSREVNVIAVTHANLLMIPTELQMVVVPEVQDGAAETEVTVSQLAVPSKRESVIVEVVADSVTVQEETMHMQVSHLDATEVVLVTEILKCAEPTKVAIAPEAVAADLVMVLLVNTAHHPDHPAELHLFATNFKKETVTEETIADSVTLLMYVKTAVETMTLVIANVVCAMISKKAIALVVMDAASPMRIKL